MLLERMSREEIIDLFKDQLLKCVKDIKIINKSNAVDNSLVQFTKGHCYLIDINEGGTFLKDDNGNWIDLYELAEKYNTDKIFVSLK
jgi:hypothetical protein